jgi:hypothetical protein
MDDLEYLYYRLEIPYKDDNGCEQQHLFAFCDLLEAEQIAYDLYRACEKTPSESPLWVIDIADNPPF